MTRHVSLNNIDHAHLKVRTERCAALGDDVMFTPVFPHEFRRIQAHYPIVFIRDPGADRFRPVALFGLEEGSNLFLSGRVWDAAYIPLTVRMKPFLIGRGGDGSLGVHIDFDHPRVSETDGEPLFLQQGGQSQLLQQIAEILGEVHEAEQALPAFTAMLDELALIEPFTLDVTLPDGTEGRLSGYYTIAEESLYGLDSDTLGRLQRAGYLQPLFMVVASLSQLTGLIERRNARLDGAHR